MNDFGTKMNPKGGPTKDPQTNFFFTFSLLFLVLLARQPGDVSGFRGLRFLRLLFTADGHSDPLEEK